MEHERAMSTAEERLASHLGMFARSRPKWRVLAALTTFAIASISTPSAWGQIYQDSTSIGAGTFANLSGQISLNQVAGVGNQQDNSALVTDIPGQLTINQESIGNFVPSQDKGSTNIGNGALAGASGLIQISQTSGTGNEAANAAFVGIGNAADAVNAISLSQMRGGFAPLDANSMQFSGHDSISPTAFAGASGVIQVQQTAGNDNVVANTLAVHVGGAISH
jgi:hypothetical protein